MINFTSEEIEEDRLEAVERLKENYKDDSYIEMAKPNSFVHYAAMDRANLFMDMMEHLLNDAAVVMDPEAYVCAHEAHTHLFNLYQHLGAKDHEAWEAEETAREQRLQNVLPEAAIITDLPDKEFIEILAENKSLSVDVMEAAKSLAEKLRGKKWLFSCGGGKMLGSGPSIFVYTNVDKCPGLAEIKKSGWMGFPVVKVVTGIVKA